MTELPTKETLEREKEEKRQKRLAQKRKYWHTKGKFKRKEKLNVNKKS